MDLKTDVEITFFVPCYNEAGNVTDTVETIQKIVKGQVSSYEIQVVDDASTDTTLEVVTAYCSTRKHIPLFIHRNPVNRGLGRSYLDCAKYSHGRYYMLINGDNDIPAEDLAAVIAMRGKADIVAPYIMNQNERPFLRRGLSYLFTAFVNLASGNHLRYYNGPVLHVRENVIRFEPPTFGFAYQAELLCRALSRGCSYLEVPFHSLKRHYGRTAAFRFSNIVAVTQSLVRIFAAARFPWVKNKLAHKL